MSIRVSHCAILATVLLLGGCTYADDLFGTNWSGEHPSVSRPAPASTHATTYSSPPSPTSANPSPIVGTAGAGSSDSTGTIVGQKVQSLRADLARLQADVDRNEQDFAAARRAVQSDSQVYFDTVARINARLQTGTTPGNPHLIAEWNQAQISLDRLNGDIAQLSRVSTQAAASASLASYVSNATRDAFALQGGVEADHRHLSEIQTQVDSTSVKLDSLLNAVSDEIASQSNYVANERDNLITLSQAIKNGRLFGPSLATRAFASAPAAHEPVPARRAAAAPRRVAPHVATAENRPLVVIRFDRPNVAYQEALYTAISRALERKPSATFQLVAVAPSSGTAAQVAVNSNASKHNAENVMRSLTDMGLPADRVTLSATTSADVHSNEVRIYVR
jgi:outer membrane murein-binding lipoprotein Lpp